MPRLGRGADAQNRTGEVNRADLLGPKIVFGHEGEASECAQPPNTRDMIAGFFHHLAVQGGNRVLTLVDTATGQLILRCRFGLMRGQNSAAIP